MRSSTPCTRRLACAASPAVDSSRVPHARPFPSSCAASASGSRSLERAASARRAPHPRAAVFRPRVASLEDARAPRRFPSAAPPFDPVPFSRRPSRSSFSVVAVAALHGRSCSTRTRLSVRASFFVSSPMRCCSTLGSSSGCAGGNATFARFFGCRKDSADELTRHDGPLVPLACPGCEPRRTRCGLSSSPFPAGYQAEVVRYLVEENRVLREQLGSRALRLNDDQRRRLAARAKTLGRRRSSASPPS